MGCTPRHVALYFIAFLFPPAAVAISRDACDTTLLLNVLLTLLAWLPGWLHATWVVASRGDPEAPWGYEPLTRPPV